MCIIVIKDKGVKTDRDLLHTCFQNNPDGCGIAYGDGKTVHVVKGLMTEESLDLALDIFEKDLEKNVSVFHFRQATAGKVIPELTHPFPIPANKTNRYSTLYNANCVLFHNGHISGFGRNSKESDTMVVAQYLSSFCPKDRDRFLQFLAETGQKFALLYPSTVITYGNFVADQKYKGYRFSNGGYKTHDSDGIWLWRYLLKHEDDDDERELICEFCYSTQNVKLIDNYHICDDCYRDLKGHLEGG